MFRGTWRNTVKDDNALQFSWYYEIRKHNSNVIRFLVFTRLNGIQMFDIWLTRLMTHLIDPFDALACNMPLHVSERPCKCQIVTDTKLQNASHIAYYIYLWLVTLVNSKDSLKILHAPFVWIIKWLTSSGV